MKRMILASKRPIEKNNKFRKVLRKCQVSFVFYVVELELRRTFILNLLLPSEGRVVAQLDRVHSETITRNRLISFCQ